MSLPPDAAQLLSWLALLLAVLVLDALHVIVTAQRGRMVDQQKHLDS